MICVVPAGAVAGKVAKVGCRTIPPLGRVMALSVVALVEGVVERKLRA